MDTARHSPTRRALLAGSGALFLIGAAGAAVRAQEDPVTPPAAPPEAEGAGASLGTLPLTPECVDDDDLTPAQTEGPYFTRNSPERTSLLEPGMPGTRLVLSGYVLTPGCQPVAGALLDFWQADDAGQYDNRGYTLRGHQFTDVAGRYLLETVVPGLYPGRTRHFHLKVQAPNSQVLTTQLYFDGEPGNLRDGIFRQELALTPTAVEGGLAATFNFVVRTA